MSPTKTYTAPEVLPQVQGLQSISTLNKWANFIQRECHYHFQYEQLPFMTYNRHGRSVKHRKTRVYSKEDIQRFNQAANYIPKIGRDRALKQAFDKEEYYNHLTTYELLTMVSESFLIERQVLEKRIVQSLIKMRQLEQTIEVLREEIEKLKQENERNKGGTFSGWFRSQR